MNHPQHSPRLERGASIWLILPWLIALVLAAVLYWAFFMRTPQQAIAQPTPENQAWTPVTAEPAQSSNAAPAISSYKDAVDRAAKSVVNIYTTQTIRHPYMNDPAFREFFEQYYGAQMQQGSTRTMVYGVAFLVSYLSQFMTLEPGDVITTGTPPGVGMGMKPPRFLKPGDIMLSIEGQPVPNTSDLFNRIAQLAPGSKSKMTVLRKDGEKTMEVPIVKRPKPKDD